MLRAAFNSNKYNWGEKAEQISSLCDSLIAAADADPIILPELQTALWRSSDKANKSGLSHLLALAGKSQCWILQQSLFYNIGWANEQVLLFCYRKIEGSHCGNFDAFFPKAILPLQCPVAGEPFSVKILLGNNGISNEIASEYNHLWVNGTEWHIDPRTGAAPIIFEKPGKHSVHLRVENQCLCNASTPGMVEQIFTVPVR
ncbi:MAG: hypothetical protein EP344_06670 [Bacteroidetes bacterium]|nr:MAG: hypothetical protein EP344_06670 [Bacteroidota bacterium]